MDPTGMVTDENPFGMELGDFIRLCSNAIESKDSEALRYAVTHFAQLCYDKTPEAVASDELVAFLDATFLSKKFQELKGSYQLLRILEYDWAAFTEPQRDLLLQAIEVSFENFRDSMAWFVLSDVMGEFYREKALPTLMRLASAKNEGPRSMVPHGLELIANECSDSETRSAAIRQIVNMKHDKSPGVRQQAEESLGRLLKGDEGGRDDKGAGGKVEGGKGSKGGKGAGGKVEGGKGGRPRGGRRRGKR